MLYEWLRDLRKVLCVNNKYTKTIYLAKTTKQGSTEAREVCST